MGPYIAFEKTREPPGFDEGVAFLGVFRAQETKRRVFTLSCYALVPYGVV